jgi:hypothetical protein
MGDIEDMKEFAKKEMKKYINNLLEMRKTVTLYSGYSYNNEYDTDIKKMAQETVEECLEETKKEIGGCLDEEIYTAITPAKFQKDGTDVITYGDDYFLTKGRFRINGDVNVVHDYGNKRVVVNGCVNEEIKISFDHSRIFAGEIKGKINCSFWTKYNINNVKIFAGTYSATNGKTFYGTLYCNECTKQEWRTIIIPRSFLDIKKAIEEKMDPKEIEEMALRYQYLLEEKKEMISKMIRKKQNTEEDLAKQEIEIKKINETMAESLYFE